MTLSALEALDAALDDGRCGARRRDGLPCANWAMQGCRRCRLHGGATPGAQRKAKHDAAEAAARRQMERLHLPPPVKISHVEAMIWLVSAKYAEVAWLREKVQSLDEEDLTWGLTQRRSQAGGTTATSFDAEVYEVQASIWWLMLRTAEDQLIKFASAAHAAGVADAEVGLAKQRGQMLGVFLDKLMAALCAALIKAGVTREDFPAVWEASIGELFPRHFRALGAVPA